jgi:hypothetical protein
MKMLSVNKTSLAQAYHYLVNEPVTLQGDQGDCVVYAQSTIESLIEDLSDGLTMTTILEQDDFVGTDESEAFLQSLT